MKLLNFFMKYHYQNLLKKHHMITEQESMWIGKKPLNDEPALFSEEMVKFHYFNLLEMLYSPYTRGNKKIRLIRFTVDENSKNTNFSPLFTDSKPRKTLEADISQLKIHSGSVYHSMFGSTSNLAYDHSLYTIPHYSEFELLFAHHLDKQNSLPAWGYDWASFPRQVLSIKPQPQEPEPFMTTLSRAFSYSMNLRDSMVPELNISVSSIIEDSQINSSPDEEEHSPVIDFLDDNTYPPLLKLDCENWFGHIISYPDYFSRWFCDESEPCTITETILPSVYEVFSYWAKTYFLVFLIIVLYRVHTLVYLFFSSLSKEDFISLRTYGGVKIELFVRHLSILPKQQYLLFFLGVFLAVVYFLNYPWWIPPLFIYQAPRHPPHIYGKSLFDFYEKHHFGEYPENIQQEIDEEYDDEYLNYWRSVRKRYTIMWLLAEEKRKKATKASKAKFPQLLHEQIKDIEKLFNHQVYLNPVIPISLDEIIKFTRLNRAWREKAIFSWKERILASIVKREDIQHAWFSDYLLTRS